MNRIVKRAIAVVVIIAALCAVYAIAVDLYVKNAYSDRIITAQEAAKLGDIDAIIVLGCQVKADGTPSHMLSDRVDTGVKVFELGAAPVLFMSGDSQRETYDETGKMRELAVGQGVPEESIQLDPLGLSTYDSMKRAKEEYGFKRILIVTQEYHLYRALFDAQKLGLEAWGVSASIRTYSGQTMRDLREILARNKDFILTLF